jgi:cation diffusion facilitator family transporter
MRDPGAPSAPSEGLRAAGSSGAAVLGAGSRTRPKSRAAALSIVSNSTLIVLKLVAGVLTGSIAILTEAIHSSIDLIASIVAFLSVRKAGAPADRDHPYGHAKVENLAAAFEGVLILAGAAVIAFESVRRLFVPAEVELLWVGIAVMGFSGVANVAVSSFLARRARATESPALEGDAAHLRTDALTSFGVLGGLLAVEVSGIDALDPIVALLVAAAIVVSGLRLVSRSSRVLVDEALPAEELAGVREALEGQGTSEIAGFHALRARRAGSDRYVDLHVQFRRGTSLERAHELAHELTRDIRARLSGADVLIHLEPEDAVRPGERGGVEAGAAASVDAASSDDSALRVEASPADDASSPQGRPNRPADAEPG